MTSHTRRRALCVHVHTIPEPARRPRTTSGAAPGGDQHRTTTTPPPLARPAGLRRALEPARRRPKRRAWPRAAQQQRHAGAATRACPRPPTMRRPTRTARARGGRPTAEGDLLRLQVLQVSPRIPNRERDVLGAPPCHVPTRARSSRPPARPPTPTKDPSKDPPKTQGAGREGQIGATWARRALDAPEPRRRGDRIA